MNIIKVAEPFIEEEEIERVVDVLKSGMFVQGKLVKEFEDKFAEYIGVKYAVATNSGTAAEHIILQSLGIGPGDEVIVPSITFFSTAASVLHQNAIPVFADVEWNTVNLDPDDFERKISDRTKAVVPVHLFGAPAEMDKIKRIAEENNLWVIEDAAQAHGAEYKGHKVGSIGDAGFWSFYATKNITSGEGGMITTNNDELAEKARIIRNHGMINRDEHVMIGYNYRLNEIQAALGVTQIPKLDKLNEIRIKNTEYLFKNISDTPWIRLFPQRDYVKNVYFWAPIHVLEDKINMSTLEIRKYLFEKGIETRHRYNEPLYKQKVLTEKNFHSKGCPISCPYYNKTIDYSKFYCVNAEKLAGKILGLPNHPNLKKENLDYIIETVNNI